MNHPVIQFYLDHQKTQNNMGFEELLHIPLSIIGNGYFYIPWLFPVTKSKSGYISKWNRVIPIFSEQEAQYFAENAQIQMRFLQATDFVFQYFSLVRQGNDVLPTAELIERQYWLRNIGHETKKISRLICSLHNCGQPELAQNLQKLAIKLGQEKGFLLPDTLQIWQGLLEK